MCAQLQGRTVVAVAPRATLRRVLVAPHCFGHRQDLVICPVPCSLGPLLRRVSAANVDVVVDTLVTKLAGTGSKSKDPQMREASPRKGHGPRSPERSSGKAH